MLSVRINRIVLALLAAMLMVIAGAGSLSVKPGKTSLSVSKVLVQPAHDEDLPLSDCLCANSEDDIDDLDLKGHDCEQLQSLPFYYLTASHLSAELQFATAVCPQKVHFRPSQERLLKLHTLRI